MRIKQQYRNILQWSLLLCLACQGHANTAIEPTPKGNWILRHLEMVERAEQGDIDVLLLGDSITDFWDKRATEVYEATFGQYKTANFGISADRTQHLLWRLRNGIGEGYEPKVTVLLIGTNNTGWEKDKQIPRNTPGETIEGVRLVVQEVQKRFPQTKLLLFALFPRGKSDNPQRAQIKEINTAISTLHDGRTVYFIDIGDEFLDENNEIPEYLMPDLLHPNAEGYKIWAKALEQPLREFTR